jgi:hypothetical protein
VDNLGDMIIALRDAEPEHKLDVYRNLGLRLTYDADTQTVRTDIDLAAHRWVFGSCPEPDLNPNYMVRLGEDLLLP